MPEIYGTDEGFLAYCDARNIDTSAIDGDSIAGARLVASEWLDNTYRSSFNGTKVGQRSQVREWPRNAAYDYYGNAIDAASVPEEVDNATYQAAFYELGSPGSLVVNWTPNKYDSVSIEGAISVKYRTYTDAWDVQTRFTLIDQILSVLISGTGGAVSSLSGGALRA